MKVLFITEVFPPRLGGDGIHVMELALHLQKLGIEVSVLTKACEGGAAFPFEVKRVGLKRNDLLGRLSFMIGALFVRPKAGVVHAHAAVGGLVGLFYKLFYKKPVVVTVHTIWGESLSSTRAKGVGAFLQWIEERVFTSNFDHYISVTGEIADKLREWGLKNVTFIPNGVNTEKFRPAKDKSLLRKNMGFGKGKILFFVGRLVKQKNVSLLLESFKLFHAKNPESKLLIAGSGPEEGTLKRKAIDLGLGKRVAFLGPMGYENLPAYYQISDCLVLTSLWEGLPLCALEALATGIPVVATRVGGLPEVVKEGHTGYFTGFDAEEVCDAIARAIRISPKKVAQESKKAAAPYSWALIAGKVRRVYGGL